MYLQCTKKMLDDVNLITLNRRKTIVCMNNLTRYPIVLYRPKTRDIAHLEEQVKDGIRAAFSEEGVPTDIVEEYLKNCGGVVYSKTAGRSLTANLNKTCETVGHYTELLDEESVIQRRISLALGRYIVKFGDAYDYPSERLFRELCKMKGMPEENWEQMLQIENYQMKVKILLDGHDIWRRILIPSRCTFRRLHRVIQETFGWFDYHLHEFTVPDDPSETKEYTPLYARPIKIRIVDGDDLLESNGERPPEDVGGPGGYEEYLRIVSDPESPEYESVVEWSKMTRAKKRTIEEINRSLLFYH